MVRGQNGGAGRRQIRVAVTVVVDPGQASGHTTLDGGDKASVAGEKTRGLVEVEGGRGIPRLVAARYRQVQVAVAIVVTPGKRSPFDPGFNAGFFVHRQRAQRFVAIELGHQPYPPAGSDVFTRKSQVQIAVVVVVAPGHIPVVDRDEILVVDFISLKGAVRVDAFCVAIEKSAGMALGIHARDD